MFEHQWRWGTSELEEKVERRIRAGLIRKVFGLVAIQLAVTACLVTAVLVGLGKRAVLLCPSMSMVGLSLQLVLSVVYMCVPDLARRFPTNWLYLIGLAVSEGFLLSWPVAREIYILGQISHVLLAAAGALCCVAATAALAWSWRKREVAWYHLLMPASLTLVVGSLLRIWLFPGLAWAGVLESAGFGLLFVGYMLADIHRLMSVQRLDVDDYVFVASALFMDISALFLEILRLLEQTNKKEDDNRRRRRRSSN